MRALGNRRCAQFMERNIQRKFRESLDLPERVVGCGPGKRMVVEQGTVEVREQNDVSWEHAYKW